MTYAYNTDDFDITATVGPLFPHYQSPDNPPEWPMYSFDRPARILWNAIGKRLAEKGWPQNEIKDFLQSKETRWLLDGDLGDALERLGKAYADCLVEGTRYAPRFDEHKDTSAITAAIRSVQERGNDLAEKAAAAEQDLASSLTELRRLLREAGLL